MCIAGFGRLQNLDPFKNRSPVNDKDAPIGEQVLCKGLQKGGGAPTNLNPGPNQFDLEKEMAPHGGGSFQISISFDNAASFKVSTPHSLHPLSGNLNTYSRRLLNPSLVDSPGTEEKQSRHQPNIQFHPPRNRKSWTSNPQLVLVKPNREQRMVSRLRSDYYKRLWNEHVGRLP